VFGRFVGFVAYETDANLRNSTMVGIVGAGGIGGTLFAAFQRFDYDFVCAIVLTIIALIMLGEVLTMRIKRIFRV
jgi:phosphonate transport system permease protein